MKYYNFISINKEFIQHSMKNYIDYINCERQEWLKENDIFDNINSENCIIGNNVFCNLLNELFKNIETSHEIHHNQEKIIDNLNEKVKNLQNEINIWNFEKLLKIDILIRLK